MYFNSEELMKNKLRILYVFGLMLMVFRCTSRSIIPDIGVIESNESLITIDVNSANPEYAAMYQLLFRGIADSSQKTPLIKVSESAARNSNPAYFENFFKKEGFKTFITSSTKNRDSSRRIVINLSALKLDLEYSAIIRKFGY